MYPLHFLGRGKVGTALAALAQRRHLDATLHSARNFRGPHLEGILVLAIKDEAIEATCNRLVADGWIRPGSVVVHLSGALSSEVLAAARTIHCKIGSMHPLHTFPSSDAALERLPKSHFFVEGDQDAVEILRGCVTALGSSVHQIEKAHKALYHAAAVVACNHLCSLLDAAIQAAMLAPEPDSWVVHPKGGTSELLTGPRPRLMASAVRDSGGSTLQERFAPSLAAHLRWLLDPSAHLLSRGPRFRGALVHRNEDVLNRLETFLHTRHPALCYLLRDFREAMALEHPSTPEQRGTSCHDDWAPATDDSPWRSLTDLILGDLLDMLLQSALGIAHLAGIQGEAARIAFTPLIEATVANVIDLGPAKALTGPIARGDFTTVAHHLEALKCYSRSPLSRHHLALYRTMAAWTGDLALRAQIIAPQQRDELLALLNCKASEGTP